jgi:hypothetical protein
VGEQWRGVREESDVEDDDQYDEDDDTHRPFADGPA